MVVSFDNWPKSSVFSGIKVFITVYRYWYSSLAAQPAQPVERSFMSRERVAAILIQDDEIALIERYRLGRHYFVFPGGGIEAGENFVEALEREMEEETGLIVNVRRLIAEVWHRGAPQHYFLVEAVGGEFGNGQGEEYTLPQPPEAGTYNPVWIPVGELNRQAVLPPVIANLVMQSHSDGWPDAPLRINGSPMRQIALPVK
jgi:8-oxo-dGTP diphosphatase